MGESTNKQSLKTKRRLMRSLEELVHDYSFDTITVKMITEHADISRQTFYRHFSDKYDLVNWTYGELVDASMRRINKDLSWEEAVQLKLEIMKKNGYFYSEIYKSNDYASLLTNDARIVYDYYIDLLSELTEGPLSEHDDFLLMLYCHGATRMTAQWARTGMKESPETLMRLYKEALPPFVRHILFEKT